MPPDTQPIQSLFQPFTSALTFAPLGLMKLREKNQKQHKLLEEAICSIGEETMKRKPVCLGLAAILVLASAIGARAQQQQNPPMFHVTMVARTIMAVNYQHRSGSTKVAFEGTPLLPLAKGNAKVDSKQGSLVISAEFKNLAPAQKFGAEYLTYVMWAITPEGKPSNLGEVLLNGTSSKLAASTPLQTFGMIVTAEPYFAVSQPSNVVILENAVRPDTMGNVEQVTANYDLVDRGNYTYDVSKTGGSITSLNPKIPLEVYEARNAVQIAQTAEAGKYAADTFAKAQGSLAQVESMLKNKGVDKKQVISAARDTVQTAADARQISLKRKEEERVAQEKAAAAEREAAAKAAADAAKAAADAAKQAADAAAAKQKIEELARQQADLQRAQAERDAAREAQARAEADAARLLAQQQEQLAREKEQAALQKEKEAQEAAARSEREKQELRARLLEQFNRVLPTTDTPRGLRVNMADVLFDTGKFALRPPAREALAKLSGIVLAHPGLRLQVEGHTDNVGGDEFNQSLSEKRATSVRDYLVQQGLDPGTITSEGFGKTMPTAGNDTPQGRQMNRRVEIIVSGEVIGTQIGGGAAAQQQ